MNSQSTLRNISIYSTQKHISVPILTQAMTSRHICPCCRSTLLRHMRSGEIYWRCSCCYQDMPV